RFSLYAFQASLDDAPFRAIDHNWNTRDLRFAADQVQEADHRCFRVDHRFVHVYIEKVRAALHLLTGDRQGPVEITRENQFRKLRRSSDIGALADDRKAEIRRYVQWFKPGESQNHV